MHNCTLSLVIPCHNQKTTLERTIRGWHQFLTAEIGSFEIILVNDGSNDGTARVIDLTRRELREIRAIHQLKLGKAAALRRAYEVARGEFLLEIDLSTPFEFSDFLRIWGARTTHLAVLGCRAHRVDSLVERQLSAILKYLIRHFFKVELKDPDTPFRLYRTAAAKHYLKLVTHTQTTFLAAMAVLIRKEQPNQLCEVTIPGYPAYEPQRLGIKHLLKTTWSYLQETSRLALQGSTSPSHEPLLVPH